MRARAYAMHAQISRDPAGDETQVRSDARSSAPRFVEGRDAAMRKRGTDRSIQIGNAMTQHVLDEDHRRSAGKNNNGAQLSARFADLPRGAVIIKAPRGGPELGNNGRTPEMSEIIQITETPTREGATQRERERERERERLILVRNFPRSATTSSEGGAWSHLHEARLPSSFHPPGLPFLPRSPSSPLPRFPTDPTYRQSSSRIVFIREPSCHRRPTREGAFGFERCPAGNPSRFSRERAAGAV